MLSQPDGPFINLSKINYAKYSKRPNLAKVGNTAIILLLTQKIVRNDDIHPKQSSKCFIFYVAVFVFLLLQSLFEYIFHHENDVRNVSTVYKSESNIFYRLYLVTSSKCVEGSNTHANENSYNHRRL